MPAISIIIPCFNVAPFLDQCIESITSQSFTDYEIICIDDCSTDDTGEILAKYESRRICHVIRNSQSKGPGAVRNIGVQTAKGEYLFFLDSDDLLAEGVLQHLYEMAKNTDADITSSQIQYFDENGKKPISYVLKGVNGLYTYEAHKFALLGRAYAVSWGRLYKKDFFLEKIGGFPEGVWYEDVIPFLKGQIYAKKLAMSSSVGVLYRQRPDSIMKQKFNFEDIRKYLNDAYALLESSSPLTYHHDFLIFLGNTYGWYIGIDGMQELFSGVLYDLNYSEDVINRSPNIKRLRKIQGKKVSLADRLRSRVNVRRQY